MLLLALPLSRMRADEIYYTEDTTQTASSEYVHYVDLTRKPIALRAVWLGAIVPGMGQIYNGSYWKLPIVYGGFAGCAYAISYTNGRYTDYKEAYRDLYTDKVLSTDPNRSYNALLPEGYTIDRLGGRGEYLKLLERNQRSFRRYRDISIVASIAVYLLSLIDAYVDAQLFDFDISDDLSLDVEPQIYYDMLNQQRNAEVKMAIHF